MSQNSNLKYLNFLKVSGVKNFLQNKSRGYYDVKNKIDNLENQHSLSDIKKLDDLKLYISKSKNIKSKNSLRLTIGEGNEKAKIMIIGELPKNEEMAEGKSITGKSEELLNNMLKAIHLERSEVYTANVIPYIIDINKKIENKDILLWLPIIQRQIEIINPYIILLMGPLAAKAILNTNLEISKLRGKWHLYKSINLEKSIECLVTLHPRHLIKSPIDKKYAWEDLKAIQKKLQYEN